MSELSGVETTQYVLDAAFADFKAQNPEVAEALETLNISFVEYLCVMAGLHPQLQTTSGNTINC